MTREEKIEKIQKFAFEIQEFAKSYRLMAALSPKLSDKAVDVMYGISVDVDQVCMDLAQSAESMME